VKIETYEMFLPHIIENVGSATGASPSPRGGRGSIRNFSAEKYPCSQWYVV